MFVFNSKCLFIYTNAEHYNPILRQNQSIRQTHTLTIHMQNTEHNFTS